MSAPTSAGGVVPRRHSKTKMQMRASIVSLPARLSSRYFKRRSSSTRHSDKEEDLVRPLGCTPEHTAPPEVVHKDFLDSLASICDKPSMCAARLRGPHTVQNIEMEASILDDYCSSESLVEPVVTKAQTTASAPLISCSIQSLSREFIQDQLATLRI